ncbi:MAG: hypothetical protein R2911_27960 [Caldilineaceae bacterium]
MITQRRTMAGMILLALLAMAVLGACAGSASTADSTGQDGAPVVTVYKSPT